VSAPDERAICASCGASLAGSYCSRCGEEVLNPHKLTVRHFVMHTLVHELLHLDGKIWRTLVLLLFRPATLALEYAAGRRRLYVNPLRVLITAIIVYALGTPTGLNARITVGSLSLSVAPVSIPAERSIEDTLLSIDHFGVLERMLTAKIGPVETAPVDVRNRFNRGLAGFATPLSFTVVAMLAFALYALFRRRRPLFVEHLVFSMHYFSFVLLWSMLAVLGFTFGLLSIPWLFATLILAILAWQFTYLTIAIRRFYLAADSPLPAWLRSASTAVLLYVVNSFFVTVVQLLGGAISIWRL
jgi:Protein of unknown function (DUF3667)